MADNGTRNPTLGEVIEAFVRSGVARMHTSIPARVRSFDKDAQTVEVEVGVAFAFLDEAGVRQPYTPEPRANVPVAYPGGGGFALYWPLAAGDEGLLVVCERSIDEWLADGGAGNVPQSHRRFDLTDAIFEPNLRSEGNALSGSSISTTDVVLTLPGGGELKLGEGAVEYVVLAQSLATELAGLKVWLDAHTHIGGGAGVPASSSPTIAESSIKADKVLAE